MDNNGPDRHFVLVEGGLRFMQRLPHQALVMRSRD
jgi:hypothetical protein